MLLGISLIVILTKGEAFGLAPYSENFTFFVAAFVGAFAGLVRIVTSYYQGYFARFAIATKSFLLMVEGGYILLALTHGMYGHIPFIFGLLVVNLIRLIIKIAHSEAVNTCFMRFSYYLLALAISGGLVVTLEPATFPFQAEPIVNFIKNNQFLFAGGWFLSFVPLLLFTISPFGRHSKITPLFYVLGGLISLVFATELAIASKISLAYSSYLTGVFILFIAWWRVSAVRVYLRRSFVLLLGLIWVASSILMGLISLKAIQEKAKEAKADRMLANLTTTASSIENIFSQNSSLMRSIIQKNAVLEITEEDLEEAVAISRQVYEQGAYIKTAGFTLENGIAAGAYPRNSLVIGTDFSSLDYFVKTRESLKGQISELLLSVLGTKTVVFTEPFFDNNNFAGMLGASFDLEKYSIDSRSQIENASSLIAVDKNGKVVLDSMDPTRIGTESEVVKKVSNGVFISKDSIVVHKDLGAPNWDLFLVSSTAPALGEISSLSVFLSVILLINSFVSLSAAVGLSVYGESHAKQ